MIPKVSIVSITYNHADFLAEAIESFVSQETDFPFEIIIHDDCSTDGTTDILREYAEKYPDIIVPVYEEQNCYSRGISIMRPLFQKARGEFIAVCEGDDYWCDIRKLQKQYDYMLAHPDCSLIMHDGYMYDVACDTKTRINPYSQEGDLSAREVIVEGHAMPPTASMFFKKKDIDEMPELFWKAPVGDRTRRMYLVNKGSVHYMTDPMCVYRLNVPGSFSQRTVKSVEQRKKVLDRMIAFFEAYDEYTEGKFHEEVELIKSREYFHFYLRSGDRKKAKTTSYYKETFSTKEKIRFMAGSVLSDDLKKKLKKILNKG